jgi:hypothetical protein
VLESLALDGSEILIKSLRLSLCSKGACARALVVAWYIVHAISLRRHSPQLNPMSSRDVYNTPDFAPAEASFIAVRFNHHRRLRLFVADQ